MVDPQPVQILAISDYPVTPAVLDVLRERGRQIHEEGWTAEHDDRYAPGELALAAGSYCESAARPRLLRREEGKAYAVPKLWPPTWSARKWWKPTDSRRDLVKAAALIIAEIERIDRAEARAASDVETCVACGEEIEDGDEVYYEHGEGGHIHATCCGPERESYCGPDGEPLADGDQIPEPFEFRRDEGRSS